MEYISLAFKDIYSPNNTKPPYQMLLQNFSHSTSRTNIYFENFLQNTIQSYGNIQRIWT